MKNILIVLSLLCCATLLFGEQIKNALVEKVLTVSAEKVLDSAFINKAAAACESQATNYNEIEAGLVYYNCRDVAYQYIFGGWEAAMNAGATNEEGNDYYIEARTIVVSKFKEYLHKEDHLLKTYQKARPGLKNRFQALPEESKIRIRNKINQALATFLQMKMPMTYRQFEYFKQSETLGIFQQDLMLLGKNMTAKETTDMVLIGITKSKTMKKDIDLFLSLFPDPMIAKFAGRRAAEGGNTLLDKYIVVLTLMAEDTK